MRSVHLFSPKRRSARISRQSVVMESDTMQSMAVRSARRTMPRSPSIHLSTIIGVARYALSQRYFQKARIMRTGSRPMSPAILPQVCSQRAKA